MKKLILLLSLLFIGSEVLAKNISLEVNQENCKKVNGIADGDEIAIAKKYKVSAASVQFIRTEWASTPYGSLSCIFIIDTAKGPKRCKTLSKLVSDDGGRTAFGSVSSYGNSEYSCW